MRKNTLFLVVPALSVLAVAGVGIMMAQAPNENEVIIAQDMLEPAAGDMLTAEAEITPVPAKAEVASEAAAQVVPARVTNIDPAHPVVQGDNPKMPRTLGLADAPVTMMVFSSLTCSHCAHAHKEILPQLIKDYVAKGKLRIVFSDFPLDQQAIDAAKVSRCVSNEQYLDFQSLLFSSIMQWAYSNNHPQALLADAVLAGLSPEKAKACLEDKDVEGALIEGLQNAAAKYNVQATPTFVFNDGTRVIAGAQPYTKFQEAIDGLLAAASQ